ncbi:MAG: superoxide dismutase, Ni [bacterium]|nr:superoxide dismutase, Ni [bacterium]
MISSFIASILKRLPLRQVWAHCDIPCGIYTPDPAVVAARTVLKMVEKIMNPPVVDEKNIDSVRNFHNAMTRYVLVKEQHAQKCKEELLILWTDYFKPEHLAEFPDLHEKFWKAAKLCSKAKQEVGMEGAQALLVAVEEIADMFRKAEAAKH